MKQTRTIRPPTLDRPSSGNIALRGTFFLVSILGFGQSSRAQQPTTWWPDPASGVMWTGEFIDPPSPYADYATAQGICSLLSVGGYTGWRLPSLDEFSTAVGPAFVYRVLDPANRIDRPSGVKKLDYNSPSPSSELEFNHFSLSPLWTSTSAGQGRVYLKKWTPPGSSVAIGMTLRGRDAGYAGVFLCKADGAGVAPTGGGCSSANAGYRHSAVEIDCAPGSSGGRDECRPLRRRDRGCKAGP